MTKQQENQEKLMQQLGVAVRLMREKKRLSIREFASMYDLDPSTLHRIENGTTLNPSVFLINQLAQAFGVTVDELMRFSVKECPTCKGTGWVKK
jgi:transcriptional regulator with XRE-family HTH domain